MVDMPQDDELKLMLSDELMDHAYRLDAQVRNMVECGSVDDIQHLINHMLDVQERLYKKIDHPGFETCLRLTCIQISRLQNRLNNHIVSMSQRSVLLGRSLNLIGLIALAIATACMLSSCLPSN